MAISVDLTPALEKVVNDLVGAGRYGSKSEVLREGLRLVQEREAQWKKLEAELEEGREDFRKGRFRPAEDVFADLEAKLAAPANAAE